MISNDEIKKCLPLLSAGWWTSKTDVEKAWYLKFWASCR